MVFGVSYHVAGRADCPYFARAERLAQMVQQTLQLHEREIQIEPIHPAKWSSHYQTVCNQLGFQSFAQQQRSAGAPDDVLVWNGRTRRLVGGEKAFRKEVAAKYGLECDLSWGRLRAIARESGAQHESLTEAADAKRRGAPIVITVVGPPGAGKSSLARVLARRYGVIRVSAGELLRQAVLGTPSDAIPDEDQLPAEHIAAARRAMLAGELVSDAIVTGLVSARLRSEDVRRVGAVLDGFPRTESQALALLDLESSLAPVAALVRMDDLGVEVVEARLEGRRIDPETQEIYHTTTAVPPTALVRARLVRRFDDQSGTASTARAQLRVYQQRIGDVVAALKGSGLVVRVPSESSQQQALEHATAALDPLATRIAAQRAAAAGKIAELNAAAVAAAAAAAATYLASPPLGPLTPADSPALTPASPVQSVPVPVTPTPDQVAASVVAQPLSRRSSLNPAAAAVTSPPLPAAVASAVPPSLSRASSRVSSRRGTLDRALSKPPTSAGASSSKPTSRRGSGVGLTKVPSALGDSRRSSLIATSRAEPSPPTHSRRVSLSAAKQDISPATISRRLSRRSMRASGSAPLLPAGATLNAQAAPAAEHTAADNAEPVSAEPVPSTSSRPASRPASVARVASTTSASGIDQDAAVASVPSAVAAAEPAPAAEEEVVLHRRGSKRASARPISAAAAAAILAAQPEAPAPIEAAPVEAPEPNQTEADANADADSQVDRDASEQPDADEEEPAADEAEAEPEAQEDEDDAEQVEPSQNESEQLAAEDQDQELDDEQQLEEQEEEPAEADDSQLQEDEPAEDEEQPEDADESLQDDADDLDADEEPQDEQDLVEEEQED